MITSNSLLAHVAAILALPFTVVVFVPYLVRHTFLPAPFWAGMFFLINTAYFLLKEEPDLVKRFGESYIRYRSRVPRWIPRLRAYRDGG